MSCSMAPPPMALQGKRLSSHVDEQKPSFESDATELHLFRQSTCVEWPVIDE